MRETEKEGKIGRNPPGDGAGVAGADPQIVPNMSNGGRGKPNRGRNPREIRREMALVSGPSPLPEPPHSQASAPMTHRLRYFPFHQLNVNRSPNSSPLQLFISYHMISFDLYFYLLIYLLFDNWKNETWWRRVQRNNSTWSNNKNKRE